MRAIFGIWDIAFAVIMIGLILIAIWALTKRME